MATSTRPRRPARFRRPGFSSRRGQVLLFAGLLLSVSGCVFGGNTGGTWGAPERPATPPDAQVVGKWIAGTGASSWVDDAGNTQFSAGTGQILNITAEGSFSDSSLINPAPYIDGFFFLDNGVATTDGGQLTLAATARSGLVRHAGESNWVPGEISASPATRSYNWRLQASGQVFDLCLTPLDGSTEEACYGKM